MDLQTSKLEIIKQIANTNDQELLDKVNTILRYHQSPSKQEFTPEQIDEIKLGIELLDKGERTSFEDFINKIS